MGNQHVPLSINEDGLVTSVGKQQLSDDDYEVCIICGGKTNVLKTTHIDYRYGYVEGAGQCCRECYNKSSDNYSDRIMKLRTTLITISAEDIQNTPNDMELGALVRNKYWDSLER
jgi:hypothetical protein